MAMMYGIGGCCGGCAPAFAGPDLGLMAPGLAGARLGNPWLDGMNPMNPMGATMNQALMLQEAQLMQWLIGMLVGLMRGSGAGQNLLGGNQGGSFGGDSSLGGGSRLGGGSSSGGGGPISTGPVAPGTEGMLDRARSMLGMTETGNTAQIQSITGKSGINPATTPWCAAFAINLMKEHGVLDTTGLSNPNYCPTIHKWAQEKGIFGQRGQYTPKPGDAILFDWGGDGTDDHIGIVEKVEGGKVYTIEGNSSDSVKRNVYDLSSPKIAGYVISGKR